MEVEGTVREIVVIYLLTIISRDSGPIFFLLPTILIRIYEYSALNSEVNGLCSVQDGQVEARDTSM